MRERRVLKRWPLLVCLLLGCSDRGGVEQRDGAVVPPIEDVWDLRVELPADAPPDVPADMRSDVQLDLRADLAADLPGEAGPGCGSPLVELPADPRCGALPPEFRYGCGCTDGIGWPKCQDGQWICEHGYTPRLFCYDCSGLDVGQLTPVDAGDAPSD